MLVGICFFAMYSLSSSSESLVNSSKVGSFALSIAFFIAGGIDASSLLKIFFDYWIHA